MTTEQRRTRRPDWVDDQLFPFESRFIELHGNTIHYVDEGEGPTLLMYHGNPTWSFLYRQVIEALRPHFRCIAFDYPGFGLSTASSDYRFRIDEHVAVSTALVDALELDEITAFVQDWGGPIGLSVATRRPDRHRGLVIGNTFAWPSDKLSWSVASAVLGGLIGWLLVDQGNLLARTVPNAHHRRSLDRCEALHYTAPFPTPARRRATRRFIDQVTGARSELESLERSLPSITDLPALILWGTEDGFYGEGEFERLTDLFPNHTSKKLVGAGHFIQSDAPTEVAEAVLAWMRRI